MSSIVKTTRPFVNVSRFVGIAVCYVLIFSFPLTTFAQLKIATRTAASGKAPVNKKVGKKSSARRAKESAKLPKSAAANQDGEQEPERMEVPAAAQATGEQIAANQAALGEYKSARRLFSEKGLRRIKESPNRENLPPNPNFLPGNQYPAPEETAAGFLNNSAPQIAAQTPGLQFTGVTGPAETGAFPPDTEGEVGPTQIVVFVNGRLRTFNKTTGAADGVINADSDVFFASVLTPPAAGEVVFSTDPNVRYDRLSNRWFLNMIDVPLNASTGALSRPNRVLLAVSDAASNGVISGGTVWTFYQFQGDATLFTDYQSFGIDASAMYIGANMFTTAGAFNSTKGFVIPKAPSLTASPLTVWSFAGLVATPSGAGPVSPRGADNPDPANTGATAVGYFVGVDNATFNTLMLRRVTNPGSLGAAPTISANISLAALTTRFPVKVPHLGNTGGTNGRLDALDDRLYSAMIRNGRLWTAHNIGVNNTGVAGATNNRNAARWYEIQNLNATPTLVQSGTLYDNNATNDANQRNYWIPTIAVSGQGHAALGCSIAGTNERVNAFTTGRLVGDPLGTMREGPGGAAFPGYTASTFAYNPPGDAGGSGGRRFGDYSATVVDPLDDMTMWTIQEYVNGTNTYGVRVVKLIAPPPATPTAATASSGLASQNVTINGTQINGSGFFDPGANLAAPARPFNHITASVSGTNVVVNSVTYVNPTQIILNLNTTGATAGDRILTVTNPDGQSQTGTLTVTVPSAAPVSVAGRVLTAAGGGVRGARVTIVNQAGETRTVLSGNFGHYRFADVPVGETYMFEVTAKRYTFVPRIAAFYEDASDFNFTAAP